MFLLFTGDYLETQLYDEKGNNMSYNISLHKIPKHQHILNQLVLFALITNKIEIRDRKGESMRVCVSKNKNYKSIHYLLSVILSFNNYIYVKYAMKMRTRMII